MCAGRLRRCARSPRHQTATSRADGAGARRVIYEARGFMSVGVEMVAGRGGMQVLAMAVAAFALVALVAAESFALAAVGKGPFKDLPRPTQID